MYKVKKYVPKKWRTPEYIAAQEARNPDLLECKFCGGKGQRVEKTGYAKSAIRGMGAAFYRGWVECESCGARSGIATNPQSVAKLWNGQREKLV
jgi:hypothetical protein